MMPAKRDFYFLLEHDDMRLTHPSPEGEGLALVQRNVIMV